MHSSNILAKRRNLNERGYWVVPDNIDRDKFDFTWRPHIYDRPYIHVFGTKHSNDNGPRFVVEEHEGLKFHDSQIAELKPLFEPSETCAYWQVPKGFNSTNFDFSWLPDQYEPPFIHQFGTAKNKEAGPRYIAPGATQVKYQDFQLLPNWSKWHIPDNIDTSSFDFTWVPDKYDLPYIHQFGTQWQPTGGPRYTVPGATEIKYQNFQQVKHKASIENYAKLIDVDLDFDYSWHPDANDPPLIYIFGNQWNDAAIEPTLKYTVEGATEIKYITNCIAKIKPNSLNWNVATDPAYKNFDYSWRPNPHSPPQIYQWENNGPIYTVPGATQVVLMKNFQDTNAANVPQYYIETTLDDLINQHKSETFWALNPDINYDKFDFTWRPDKSNFMHINVFGSEHSQDIQTYYINGPAWALGNKLVNYVDSVKITVDTNLDMFYVIVGVESNNNDFAELVRRYPQIQKTRYAASWIDTIKRCIGKAKSRFIRILSSEYDYSNTQLNFYPSTWQQHMLHVIGSQWNRWSHVYLVNCETFLTDSEYINEIEHLPNINHVSTIKVLASRCNVDVLYIDLGNTESDSGYEVVKQKVKNVHQIKYDSSYLNTLKLWLEQNPAIKERKLYSVWVTSSICDYAKFDFTWYSDPFQQEQIHVFASQLGRSRQQFGDTFFIPLSILANEINELDDLANYSKKINFISYITAQRYQHPVIKHEYDSQVLAVLNSEHDSWPYTEYQTKDYIGVRNLIPNIWDSDKTEILVGSRGASQLVLPSKAKFLIEQEIYDYPLIAQDKVLEKSRNLDIIFISNGEPSAEQNWQRLQTLLASKKITNKLHRVKDVPGRVASQLAAANQSTTDWYFLVNGKIEISENFDWSWQPDRLQQPKHYIFTVTNPVNGLEYGHQAIVANNKKLTLATVPTGLDFTLNSLHEVVDMNCGIARYNTDAWTTWRTAFREGIKLRNNTDSVSRDRLHAWLTMGQADYGEWSMLGARDGVEYWENVSGDLEKLMLSYDWRWIQDLFNSRYN